MRSLLLAPLALALLSAQASARTWQILNDGSGDAPTVQAGIDSASAGDTVLVAPGTYLENLSIVAKDLVLVSEQGPDVTTLDGSNEIDSVIYMSGQTRETMISGFRIVGGVGRLRDSVADGGGIQLADGASPRILNNAFVDNGALGLTFFGGAIASWTEEASPCIEDNLFERNEARLGGAISLTSGDAMIRNNVFRENTCSTDGGALYATINLGYVTIERNEFSRNNALDHGGALDLNGDSSATIIVAHNLFVENRADGSGVGDTGSGGAIRILRVSGAIAWNTIVEGISSAACGGGGISLESTPATLEIYSNIIALNEDCGISCRSTIEGTLGQNLFWMNAQADLGRLLGSCPSWWAQSQIFADPLFCDVASDDFHLAENSPANGMGAYQEPTCPPVSVRPITWGRIKSLFR
jgi:predicted outer membrane repeat protein